MRGFAGRLLIIVSVLLLAVVFILVVVYLIAATWIVAIPPNLDGELTSMAERPPLLLSPQWSPDGTFITFGNTFDFKGEIFSYDINRMRLHPVHSTGSIDLDRDTEASGDVAFAPSVSPDGSRIAFAALEHATWLPWIKEYHWEIVTSDLYGSRRRTLTRKENSDLHPAWSPDGDRIAFVSGRRIRVMGPDGSDVRILTPSIEATRSLPPVWSPDGRSIAFVGKYEDVTMCGYVRVTQRILYVVDTDGGEPQGLGLILDSTLPAWSPDGRRIAFSRLKDCLAELYTVAPDGSEASTVLLYPLYLYLTLGPQYGTSWSPDGGKILMGTFVVEVDGSVVQRLPTPVSTASWSPDGSRIAVHILNDGFRSAVGVHDVSIRLYTIAPDGSDIRVLVKQDLARNLSAANGRSGRGSSVPERLNIDGSYGCYYVAEPGVLLKHTNNTRLCDEG